MTYSYSSNAASAYDSPDATTRLRAELDAARERLAALETTGRTLAAALAGHRFDARDPVVAALVAFRAALDAAPAETGEQLAALEAVAEAAREFREQLITHDVCLPEGPLWAFDAMDAALDATLPETSEQLAARLTDRVRALDAAPGVTSGESDETAELHAEIARLRGELAELRRTGCYPSPSTEGVMHVGGGPSGADVRR